MQGMQEEEGSQVNIPMADVEVEKQDIQEECSQVNIPMADIATEQQGIQKEVLTQNRMVSLFPYILEIMITYS